MHMPETTPNLLAVSAALLGLLYAAAPIHAEAPLPDPEVDAQFHGCESAGWCRFVIDALDSSKSPYRVRPDGVPRTPVNDVAATAIRDRLNALLASMIHQHKRIVLHHLRELDDGTLAAAVTVNGANLASDPILVELRANLTGMPR
jgi:hypothetical protein